MTDTAHTAPAMDTHGLGVNDDRIPATILTGFLGSGKTTLLNRILAANTGLRIAIIVNEIGEIGIDGGLIEQTSDADDIVELTAGCICCTIRGDLLVGIQRILERPEPPEYLIIETSGIADPLPVAQTLFLPYLRQLVRLDGIVTVVDAEQVFRQLRASQMVAEQLEYANIVVLSKVDLVDAEMVAAAEDVVRERNPYAPVLHNANDHPVDLRLLLDVGAFQIDDRFTAGAEMWLEDEQAHERLHHRHDGDDHDDAHDHHDGGHLDAEGIGTLSFVTREPFATEKLEAFWNAMPENVLRGKGVLHLAEYDQRCIFHQVGARVTVEAHGAWRDGEGRESRLVFIGTHLDADALRAGLRACLAG